MVNITEKSTVMMNFDHMDNKPAPFKGDWVQIRVTNDRGDPEFNVTYTAFLTNHNNYFDYMDGIVGISPGLKKHDEYNFGKKLAESFNNDKTASIQSINYDVNKTDWNTKGAFLPNGQLTLNGANTTVMPPLGIVKPDLTAKLNAMHPKSGDIRT